MPVAFAVADAEIAKRQRKQPSVVIGGEEKGRSAILVFFKDGWNLFRAEE
jgi:hypothetical protein